MQSSNSIPGQSAAERTAEALPIFDAQVILTPEACSFSVEPQVTLPAAPQERRSLKFGLRARLQKYLK